jgi:hypothetical protein
MCAMKTYSLAELKAIAGISESATAADEHSVVVYFNYRLKTLDPLFELDSRLDKLITQAGVGQYDWHEIALEGSEASIYMYGPNAEILFKTVQAELQRTPFMKGAVAHLRFGGIHCDAPEIEVEIL